MSSFPHSSILATRHLLRRYYEVGVHSKLMSRDISIFSEILTPRPPPKHNVLKCPTPANLRDNVPINVPRMSRVARPPLSSTNVALALLRSRTSFIRAHLRRCAHNKSCIPHQSTNKRIQAEQASHMQLQQVIYW